MRRTLVIALALAALPLAAGPSTRHVSNPQRVSARRIEGRLSFPVRTEFSPRDHLYRLEVRRINLRGGAVSRFLTMTILINCGDDAELVDEMGKSGTRVLNDALVGLFNPLAYEDVCRPSQKNDLRERMIILFNNTLGTTSIRDIYYDTFIVY
jgi:flagellar basal body-associated protein FliL